MSKPEPTLPNDPLKPKADERLKARHEIFASGIAKGLRSGEAYVNAGYKGKGALASASRLLRNAEISRRIGQIRTTLTANLIQVAIRNKNRRLMAYQDLADGYRRLMEARAKDPLIMKVPGGETGLVTAKVRTVDGPHGQKVLVIDSVFDAALQRAILDTLRLAAIEVGQWPEKRKGGRHD
jgi:hypothetical protein